MPHVWGMVSVGEVGCVFKHSSSTKYCKSKRPKVESAVWTITKLRIPTERVMRNAKAVCIGVVRPGVWSCEPGSGRLSIGRLHFEPGVYISFTANSVNGLDCIRDVCSVPQSITWSVRVGSIQTSRRQFRWCLLGWFESTKNTPIAPMLDVKGIKMTS